MKLKLINILHPSAVYSPTFVPMLGTAIVAGLTPEYVDVEIVDLIKDEEFTIDKTTDLVGISTITHTSIFAYKIAQKYREIGKKVVIGGMHVSVLPDEALRFCDSVVIGEAELVWKSVIDDFIDGKLKPIYKASSFCSMDVVPQGRVDLLSPKYYISRAAIHASRGCPHACDFCCVTNFYGNTYRMRSVNKVIEEIENMRNKDTVFSNILFFTDDNIACNKKYAKTLFSELKGLDIWWGSQCNMNVAEDKELLQLLGSSGCVYLYLGIETIFTNTAKSIKKSMNNISKYEDQLKKIKDAGVVISGSFIIGLDGENARTIDSTLEFINKNNIDIPHLCMYTPLPGTVTYQEMEKENRLITKDWSKYDVQTVVFKPKLMTPEALQKKYNEAVIEMNHRYIEGTISLGKKLSAKRTT